MKKREITRNKILQSGWSLFQQKGYTDTTSREIAHHAGVASGTVFSHFPSKLDILKVAMLQQLDTIIARAKQSDQQHSARLKLRHYASHLYQFYLSHREFSKELLGNLIWQAPFFQQQLELFKSLLFSEQAYQPEKAALMMDSYFMTLLEGLNDPNSSVDSMLATLSQKLKLIA